ncbi:FtsX-like permease family protein [Kribbella sandramycini]|uniref:FtsX-like permease family protein n=1 Tax=Kribbella sandramycini TaxID=60450 RepID=A0A7Y4KXS3_9ACTN|nr:FtsX-like permease family protein [Kribbella sandramycini]MBB6569563.1 putative ABC transport system permease protein [Kribbella sandramycini]NOL40603.1 FtsX-like permease family protein [Kribbella sandramycini]
MLELGLRSVLAHRLRFVLCTVAVVLGVAFVGGAMVFTDTLSAALKAQYAGSTADLTVTPVDPVGRSGPPATVTAELADQVAAVPGVAEAGGQVLVADVQILRPDGKPIETYGLPAYGASWPQSPRTALFTLMSGEQPFGKAELGLDRSTASDAGYRLGDQVRVVTANRVLTAELTAITTAAQAGVAAGAPLVTFDAATAQLVLLGKPGWTSVAVALAPGADADQVRAAIATKLGATVEVRTAAQVEADGESALDATFGGFSSVLLMFAGLALFVGAFLIVNTFAMQVAQRTRELAMLRAIGASRGQVTATVLAEAFVVGVIGSTLGLLLGIGVAAGIQLVYRSLGTAVPTTGLQVGPATIVACYLIGIVLTLAAAYPSARRAGKLPPMAALREGATIPERSLLVRLLAGAFLLLMAGVFYAIAHQIRGLPGAFLLALGAAMALLGIVLTSPLVSRYVVRALLAPLGRAAPVTLGRRNAERNPRRTSATASALMISVALISGLIVIAASARASIDKSIADAIGTSDLVVSSAAPNTFSPQVADQVRQVAGVAAVHQVRRQEGKVDDTPVTVTGVAPGTLNGPITVTLDSGTLDGLAKGEVLLPRTLATTLGLTAGEKFTLTTTTGKHELTVSGIIAPNRQANAVVLTLGAYDALGAAPADSLLYVDVAEGISTAQAGPAILERLKDYPTIEVRDQQAYAAQARGPVNIAAGVIGMLLALAILIAILGIVNTLALGVVERTREIGLLRAIGMDRPQLRRMLRVESIAIALLGSLLGLAVGVVTAASIQRVLVDNGLGVLDVPVLQLLGAVLAAGVIGVLAAVWPSRRAARLDVLQAIATE